MVQANGFLDMGTSSDFIPKNINAEIIWVLTQAQADAYVGGFNYEPTDKGLWVFSGGTWEVHGAPLLRPWSKIAQDAAAGSNIVIVDNDVPDWYIGGIVIVTQTSNPRTVIHPNDPRRGDHVYKFENELRTITALEKLQDGKTKITLDISLTYLHEGTAPFKGEVGLLTRNILFKTDLLGVSESAIQNDVGLRKFAHTLRFAGSSGSTQYAEFKYMGHYGTLSRYTTHQHQMGPTSKGMVIRGNAMWYTGFRWINVHSSEGIVIEDNVGFSSAGVGYFVEADSVGGKITGISKNLVFIHNLGVKSRGARFSDRGGVVEFWRMAAFWPSNSKGEAFIGNVAVGTFTDVEGKGSPGGYHHSESSGGSPGTMGQFFIGNEAHSNQGKGHFTWQNFREATRELVGSLMWRNGKGGFGLGAYSGEYYVYNARLLENYGSGISSTIVDAFAQDSLYTGTVEADGSKRGIGSKIGAYFTIQAPQQPHVNLRNTYRNLAIGYTHSHATCDIPTLEKIVVTKTCGADYSLVQGNIFENVDNPINFGWQANANAWWYVSDLVGVDPSLQGSFYLNRKDQDVPANQGPESARIIGDGSSTTYNELADALQTPTSPRLDYPPQVTLDVAMNGKQATITATPTDDNQVTKLEFFVDWIKVATVNNPAATESITVDLANIPGDTVLSKRKYAYLWARAFDGTTFLRERTPAEPNSPYPYRAYSNIIEIGPEVLLLGQALPPPPPDTTPPVRFNPQPSGSLTSGTTQTTISLTTIEAATCKFSTTSGIDYDDPASIKFITTGTTSHSTLVTGLSDGNTFNYFVRCKDTAGNKNTDDFKIQFSIMSKRICNNGDVNNDGTINVLDLILIGQQFGQTGNAGFIPEDVNCDGIVNVLDMIATVQQF